MTSPSPLAKFTYDTFDIQASPYKTIRRPGHRLGPLAAVKLTYQCPNCDKDHQIWTILNLASAAYVPFAPVFRNLDDAAEFILDVVDLFDWPTADIEVVKRHSKVLLEAILSHEGFPIAAMVDTTNVPEHLKKGVAPGTQGFNGYPQVKQ